MRKAILSALLLCGALAAFPLGAEVFTITLTNGSTFESRYMPRQAAWDPAMIELIVETGNWIALPKNLVQSTVARSESRGFGRIIDTTTLDLGFAPNDVAEAEEAGGVESSPMEQAFESRAYDQRQFVEPGEAGGGLPIFGFGGGAGGSRRGGGSSSSPTPAPAPAPAPAPTAPQ
jgi:hypothetical protein